MRGLFLIWVAYMFSKVIKYYYGETTAGLFFFFIFLACAVYVVLYRSREFPKRLQIREKLPEIILILGGTLLTLRLFFPPVYLKYGEGPRKYLNFIKRFEHDRYYSDYSLALLHALSIAIATGIIFYLLIERRKHEERYLSQRLTYIFKQWNIEDRANSIQILKGIFKKYEIKDKKTKNLFFTLLEYPFVEKHYPTKEELESYPVNVMEAVRDYCGYCEKLNK